MERGERRHCSREDGAGAKRRDESIGADAESAKTRKSGTGNQDNDNDNDGPTGDVEERPIEAITRVRVIVSELCTLERD